MFTVVSSHTYHILRLWNRRDISRTIFYTVYCTRCRIRSILLHKRKLLDNSCLFRMFSSMPPSLRVLCALHILSMVPFQNLYSMHPFLRVLNMTIFHKIFLSDKGSVCKFCNHN